MKQSPARVVVCGPSGAGKTTLVHNLVNAGVGDRQIVEISSSEESLEDFSLLALKADVLVAVVDATRGASPRTWWQSYLALRLGVGHVVVAVNKVDCVEHPEGILDHMERRFAPVTGDVVVGEITVVPVVALLGHNVLEPSPSLSWYAGPSLLECINQGTTSRVSSDSVFNSVCADAFEATLVWTAAHPMLQGRSYVMQRGAKKVAATVAPLKYKIDAETLQHSPAKTLGRGEIGVCSLELQQAIDFSPQPERRDLRVFVLHDAISEAVVGVGLLHFELRRSQNIRWQPVDIDKAARAALHRHKPCIIWFTGLSGAGKSTIANLVELQLHARGCNTYLLDGDNVRHGLNKDLGFTDADRVENIRRVAEVARLMVDAGLIVLVSFISPFTSERRMARALVEEGEFMEVFVDVPLEVAEARDPKGLYRKARRGELKNFTGLDSPYEAPERPEIRLDTSTITTEQAAQGVLHELERLLRPSDERTPIR